MQCSSACCQLVLEVSSLPVWDTAILALTRKLTASCSVFAAHPGCTAEAAADAVAAAAAAAAGYATSGHATARNGTAWHATSWVATACHAAARDATAWDAAAATAGHAANKSSSSVTGRPLLHW